MKQQEEHLRIGTRSVVALLGVPILVTSLCLVLFGHSKSVAGDCYGVGGGAMCGDGAGAPYPRCERVKFNEGQLGQVDNDNGNQSKTGKCGQIRPGFQQPLGSPCGHDSQKTDHENCPPDDDDDNDET